MGNAVPQAIAAADWTTGHNEDDGLAQAIEHLLAIATH
jgi:hydroxymethylpyrimidine pyrophosphatase-like HAD family hydrolase